MPATLAVVVDGLAEDALRACSSPFRRVRGSLASIMRTTSTSTDTSHSGFAGQPGMFTDGHVDAVLLQELLHAQERLLEFG